MDRISEKYLFEKAPIWQAITRLAVPTVIGQIILVIYNMADTFFIGLTGDDTKVTALTICMPAFMFLSAISNLFGIGGSSAISRAFGKDDPERVRHASAFSMWGCVFVTVGYMILTALLVHPFVNLLGGTEPVVHSYAVQYILITVVIGGLGTSLSAMFSHLIRAEGHGIQASLGIALGGVLNILLDPLFMFVICRRGQEVLGAAIATMLSNFFSLLFFAATMIHCRHRSALSFRFREVSVKDGVATDVFAAGLPACMMTLCENVSYAVLDKLLSRYGILVQAGIGVAKKVNMLAHCIVRGMAQGVLPLIGYNYASGNHRRMKRAAAFSTGISVACAGVCMAASLAFSRQLIELFLQSGSASVDYGAKFLRILCIGGPFSACAYTCISFFQATGKGKSAFLLAIMRKGVLDIPLMFLLNGAFPLYGATWATPIADGLCCVTSVALVLAFFHSQSADSGSKICNRCINAV